MGLCIRKWKGFRFLNQNPAINKKAKKVRSKALIKFPWQKNAKEILQTRKDKHQAERDRPNKKIKRLRVKFPERHRPSTIGPGYPGFGLVYANMEIARGDRERRVVKKSLSGTPLIFEPLKTDLPHPVPDNVFEEFCQRVGIETYVEQGPSKEPKNALDLRAFDLYWEDIRIERDLIVKELKAPVDLKHLAILEKSIYNISRSCYYAPVFSHRRSEDMVHLMVWFLNRRNLPIAFHIKVLQAVSLIVHLSPTFKLELVRCGGVRVLIRSIQIGQIVCGLQSCWACYALTVAAMGSPDITQELQETPDFDETIAEMNFGMYWYYWPTNFANILQSLVFGPGGVTNVKEA